MRRNVLVIMMLAAGLAAGCQRSARDEARTQASPETSPSPRADASPVPPAAEGGAFQAERGRPPEDPRSIQGAGTREGGDTASRTPARRAPARPAEPEPADDADVEAPDVDAADRTAADEVRPEESTPSQPTYRAATLPEGTVLPVRLRTALSSEKSRVEDRVVAEVSSPVRIGGRVVVPAGSELRGHVTAARESGRVKGRARLAVDFDTLVVRGRSYRVETSSIDVTAPDAHERDAAIVGGSTAVGAIVGAIAGGGKSAKRGAVVGAATGAAAVLITRGREVEIPAGSAWRIRLTDSVRL